MHQLKAITDEHQNTSGCNRNYNDLLGGNHNGRHRLLEALLQSKNINKLTTLLLAPKKVNMALAMEVRGPRIGQT